MYRLDNLEDILAIHKALFDNNQEIQNNSKYQIKYTEADTVSKQNAKSSGKEVSKWKMLKILMHLDSKHLSVCFTIQVS